jgi:environmental stress-induced protein Ves
MSAHAPTGTTARVIRAAEVTRQRWRNGGGWTRELLAWPAADAWQVRVGVADVEADSPFSVFAGVERWFAVLHGAGVELSVDGALHRLTPQDAPLRFSGSAATHCRLIDGPTRDLNLMLREAAGAMVRVAAGHAWSPRARGGGLFAAVPGRCHAGDRIIDVPADALLWFERVPRTLAFEPSAAAPADAIGWWLAASTAEHVA